MGQDMNEEIGKFDVHCSDIFFFSHQKGWTYLHHTQINSNILPEKENTKYFILPSTEATREKEREGQQKRERGRRIRDTDTHTNLENI